MKFVLTLGLIFTLPILSASSAQAEDVFEAQDLSSNLTNDLGHGSCATFEKEIEAFEKCLKVNNATEGSRTGIYKCGNRPQLPERC